MDPIPVHKSALRRGRKRRRYDPAPGTTAAQLRAHLEQLGFKSLSKMTKIELALKLERERRLQERRKAPAAAFPSAPEAAHTASAP